MKKINIKEFQKNTGIVDLYDYIKVLCSLKGITVKELCQTLDINYRSLLSNLYNGLSIERFRLIFDYLEGDFNIAIHLPLRLKRKK